MSIGTTEFDNKEHAARKDLENFRTRNKPLERGYSRGFRKRLEKVEDKGQTARKELSSFRRRSTPLERDWRISKETGELKTRGKPLERN